MGSAGQGALSWGLRNEEELVRGRGLRTHTWPDLPTGGESGCGFSALCAVAMEFGVFFLNVFFEKFQIYRIYMFYGL